MSALPVPLFTDNIPKELKALPQWVCWRYETRDGKPTKVPICPQTGARASTTNSTTWSTFGEATLALEWGHHDGIGFVFADTDPFFMIDLDDARDIDMNLPWADEIVNRLPIYWEVSPSGSGLRGIGRGTLPAGGNRKGQIELYDRARFATITGQLLSGDEIGGDCTPILQGFHRELFEPVIAVATPVQSNPETPPMSDDEVLDRALNAKNGDKLRKLLEGDTTDYTSQSEAEMACVGLLKFWTQDAEQIERILRLSGLQRDKWDRNKTYIDRTITNALQQPSERYEPPNNVIDFRKHLGEGSGGNGHGGGAGGGAGGGSSEEPPDDDTVYGFRLSDLGNGQRLAQRVNGKARWCKKMKAWFVYDEQRWNSDSLEYMMQWSQESVLTMYDAVSSLPAKERTELLKHAMKSESERALNAAISQAKPHLAINPDAFDLDPMLLNVENGTIDLRTGELRPHDPTDMIAKLAPVQFDPDAQCPKFLEFLDQIFEGDQERIAYLQRVLGYCLTGDTRERAVFIAYGSGRNGKTTLSRLMMSIVGDYAKRTPTETIMASRNSSSIPNDIAALVGSRFVTVSETEEGRRLNVSKVKDMAGDENLVACFKYGEFFEYRPQFKLWISTNHKPVIPGNDRAIFDRFHLIPFDFRVPDDQVDKTLEAKLLAESSGILNWLMAGCMAWQQSGLKPPQTVTEATEQYRVEMDQIGSFFADRCVIQSDAKATATSLYSAYKAWCEINGEKAVASNWFGRQLAERGFQRKNDGANRAKTWFGIGLLDDKAQNEPHSTAHNGNFKESQQSSPHEAISQEMRLHTAHTAHTAQDDGGWL